MSPAAGEKRDFFISRTGVDAPWAQWIAQELEKEGYTTFLQDWDFVAGPSFVENMRKGAECPFTIAVLSPDYWTAHFTQPELEAAFAKHRLILVRVRPCDIPALLGHYIYIDLVNKTEDEARQALLDGVSGKRMKRPASFPGTASTAPAPFPGPQYVSVAKLPAFNPLLIGARRQPGLSRPLSRSRPAPVVRRLRSAYRPWQRGEVLSGHIRRERSLLILDGLEPLQFLPGPQHGRLKDPA